MVKFVGGPSYGGYKSYINHTTAREGQWRMPRNYKPVKIDIDFRKYSTCCHQPSFNTGFQLPAWLQWAQFSLGLLSSFIPQKEAPAVQPETNPLQKQLEEMQKQIDDLKKENQDLKNKKTDETTDPKKTVANQPAAVTNPETAQEPAKAEITADIKKITTQGEEKTENVVYEPSYFKAEKKRSHWYDFAQAYDIPKGITLKQVYQAIQKRNGYSAQNQEPPRQVMLPLVLDINGVEVRRKDQYSIPKHDIPQNEKGNCVGRATGGTPTITKGEGSTTYNVYKNNTLDKSGLNEQQARNRYKDITGKDFSGTIADE